MKTAGFTLIEVLMVLLIISIISGAVLFSLHPNPNRRLNYMATEISDAFILAQQQALLNSSTLGFFMTAHDYQFYIYQKNSWLPLSISALNKKYLPKNYYLTLTSTNGATTTTLPVTTPQLIINANGEILPFTLILRKKSSDIYYQIIGDNNNLISVQQGSVHAN